MKRPRLLLTTLAFGLLLATSTIAIAIDNDGDGVELELGDCDDSNPSIHPGAVELVGDDVDQDCDAHEDCYLDGDDDGYRTTIVISSLDSDCADITEARASDPTGDCDDSDPDVNPGATEVCDGGDVDDDCDGLPDDFDSFAAGKTSWYADADSDGYGSASSSVVACDAPVGHVADSTDCDDASAAVHPTAGEVCDAGNTDEDCDGTVDDADLDATGKTTWYADADADGYGGGGGGGTLACDAPIGTVGNDGDCDDADAAVNPGTPEICDAGGTDDDCDGLADCDDSSCSSEPSCLGTVEVFDHLECFKIKTTEKLKATLNVDPGTNPPFEVAPGCTIGKATKYCVPVMKTVAVLDDSSTLTPDAGYEGQDLTDDRICYKVKCPDTAATTITLTVHDRFGSRDFTKFKSTEICTPAEQAP